MVIIIILLLQPAGVDEELFKPQEKVEKEDEQLVGAEGGGERDGEKDMTIPRINKSFLVEPLNKGHFGANSFVPCREVVPISEVK